MTSISVGFKALQDGIDATSRHLTALDQQRTDVDTYLKSTLGGSWEGGGSEAHTQTQQDWINAADGAHNIMRDLKSALEMALANYMNTEATVRGRFGG